MVNAQVIKKLNFKKTYNWKHFAASLFLILGIMATIAVLIFDGKRLLEYSFHLNPSLVVFSIIIGFSGLIFIVPAWHLILARLGKSISYWDDLRIYCYSFIGYAIPGGIWSFVGRAALYEREGVSAVQVTVAGVIEMMLIGVAGLIVYGGTLFFHESEQLWQRPEIAIGIAIIALIIIQPPIFNYICQFILQRFKQTTEYTISLSYTDLAIILSLEIVVIIIGGTAIYFLLKSFVATTSDLYITMVRVWAVGVAAGHLLFWFPGKPILRDGAIVLTLSQAITPSLALIFVIIVRLWTIVSAIIAFAIAWLILRPKSQYL
ncbi:MAG: hypothetical protein B6242_16265 [Anaerolineaceae bacterium 4572_78]|nr:MAG: hypothetical protein B6242_16265 [Anaerolineaceae bacterium 4572_78]